MNSSSRAVVTGGAGFIGSHLVEALVEDGMDTVVLDDLSAGSIRNLDRVMSRISFERADVRDVVALRRVCREADIVYHCAANASVPVSVEDPARDFEVNAVGTQRLLLAARDAGVRRIVLCSSAAVYGIPQQVPISEEHPLLPVSPYGASKASAEMLALAYGRVFGLDVAICRIFNTYGPRQRRYVMHDLYVKLIRQRSELSVRGDGNQIRDYLYVGDTTRAIRLVSLRGQGVYNIGSGQAVSIRQVAEAMVRRVSPGARIRFGEATWKGDISTLHADVRRLHDLGFRPRYDLESGLAALVEEHRNAL